MTLVFEFFVVFALEISVIGGLNPKILENNSDPQKAHPRAEWYV